MMAEPDARAFLNGWCPSKIPNDAEGTNFDRVAHPARNSLQVGLQEDTFE